MSAAMQSPEKERKVVGIETPRGVIEFG